MTVRDFRTMTTTALQTISDQTGLNFAVLNSQKLKEILRF
jgi:hypothetical protein